MSSQSRHVYTRNERVILEASFASEPHPNVQEKERLAKLLNCNLIQISNWFQNHRRRLKKQIKIKTKTITKDEPIISTPHDASYYQFPTAGATTCPYCINDDQTSYYYHWSPSQYILSHESYNTQPISFDNSVAYRT
ncbi:unnamed protein product [Adineta ricciae]|uniref:Homeobox domain-containing protein n=1 Tax=Adineta ricciae TaxID=249248 RepID=A0A815T9W1_ADIRI|nr:unnamed protein product [Adineta ricciae]